MREYDVVTTCQRVLAAEHDYESCMMKCARQESSKDIRWTRCLAGAKPVCIIIL